MKNKFLIIGIIITVVGIISVFLYHSINKPRESLGKSYIQQLKAQVKDSISSNVIIYNVEGKEVGITGFQARTSVFFFWNSSDYSKKELDKFCKEYRGSQLLKDYTVYVVFCFDKDNLLGEGKQNYDWGYDYMMKKGLDVDYLAIPITRNIIKEWGLVAIPQVQVIEHLKVKFRGDISAFNKYIANESRN